MKRTAGRTRRTLQALAIALTLLPAAGCATSPDPYRSTAAAPASELPAGAECLSLEGRPLFPPPLAPEAREERERELAGAWRTLGAHPDDPDAWIWVGRRTAYLNRFREALALFEAGAARFPEDPRFPRHIGHRLITLRRFPEAERALERAAHLAEGLPDEIEPAGLPNPAGIELATRNQEIHYHLALARYLQSDFSAAATSWRECLRWTTNDDARLAATAWLYVALRRANRPTEAAAAVAWVRPDIDVVEYHGYHRLCLLYAGLADPESLLADLRAAGDASVDLATVGYGLANWHHVEGRPDVARELLEEITTSPSWHAFGAIATEADLARRAGGLCPDLRSSNTTLRLAPVGILATD